MAILRAGYAALALKIQEAMDAGDALSANDIRSRLSDAINDAHRGTGKWAYYIDHFGDGESGDVIYCCDGDTCRASYEIVDTAGSAKCTIDMENAEDVVPRTIYEPEADEADHIAAMEESLKTEKLYTALPLYERFIAKAERDKAGADDFAGKGKSFPILKPGDVQAAVHAMGRAGSSNMGPSGIKARIIAIAKRKGWTAQLPKAWQDGEEKPKESAPPPAAGTLKLVESCPFAVDIQLREAFTPGKMIKLIAPGKGSTAYYTEAVLKQAAADKIFAAGTPMRIDHPTKAEEAARPEGSVKDWGAVLESDAVYRDDLPTGKGLYAPIKKFSDHAQTIEEKGPYAGVSIRANGNALMEAGRPVMRDGVPVLAKFTSAEGADMVTRAGAGGMFLSEAAVPPIQTQEAAQMTAPEVQALVEAEIRKARLPFDAQTEATRLLETVQMKPETKQVIVEGVLRGTIPVKDNALDKEAFGALVVAEAQRIGRIIAAESGGCRVFGMGVGQQPTAVPKPEEIAAREAAAKRELEEDIAIYERQGMSRKAAEFAAKGRPEEDWAA